MSDFNRDRWGRPLIQVDGKSTPYTRISSYGQILEDQTGLNRWKLRMVVSGIGQRPDLVNLAAANIGNDRKLDDLAQQLLDIGGASKAANTGTAIHESLAKLDTGETAVDDLPDMFIPYAKAWLECLDSHGLELVPDLVEIPLVNDQFQAAGSSDNFLLRTADNRLVAVDKKTGKQIGHRPLAYMVQLALYATSQRYDVTTGERTPVGDIDLDVGYIAHIPATGAGCTLYEVDLQQALELCHLAQNIRKAQKTITPVQPAVVESKVDIGLLVDRVTAIAAAGHAGSLAAYWPDGVKTFKHSREQSQGDLLLIKRAVEKVEAEFQMPFGVETPPVALEAKGKPRKAQKETVEEGRTLDTDTVAAIRKHIKQLPEGSKLLLADWAKQASKSGQTISLSALPSERRFEIARAMVQLTKHEDPATVLNRLVEMRESIGATFATMSIETARDLCNKLQEVQ